nr:MAG TPA: hypothetical protein [Caudoviricetes sp.]
MSKPTDTLRNLSVNIVLNTANIATMLHYFPQLSLFSPKNAKRWYHLHTFCA